jgi:glutamate-1-semialdehyde 2,1-aminomutase
MQSEAWLARAERTIPLGSQTFSKSRTQYPVGISPLFISHAKGANVWDLDGRKYVDLVNSLGSVTFGYGDPGVDKAIRKQLKKGISFSLPGRLEALVAEKMVEIIPSAEMVRFAKNGSDATSAAIRLARAYTGREKVAVCGYHGWQDWFIGSTSRNKGVPKSVSELTNTFQFNDLNSLTKLIEESTSQYAAVIMEPMNSTYPSPGFLQEVRSFTKRLGIVLIFDETITGFRFAKGGAQEYFGITPDLSTFGKGIANGMPISAVVGAKEIMLEMEEIFFSGTFGGELLSLAAANNVIDRVMQENVINKFSEIGELLSAEVSMIVKGLSLEKTLNFSGHPSWKFLNWTETNGYSATKIRTLFMQEMFKQGVLLLGTHNVSLSHKKREISAILRAYEIVLSKIANHLQSGSLDEILETKPLEPIFRVR